MPARFNSFFNSVEGNEGDRCHYPTRLDTYGCGCQHNCGYCYARSLLAFRGLWNPMLPATADIKEIRKIIVNKLHPGDVVRLGGMTDCFQPLEKITGFREVTVCEDVPEHWSWWKAHVNANPDDCCNLKFV